MCIKYPPELLCANHCSFLLRSWNCLFSALREGPKRGSNVPFNTLPKWALQCFVPDVSWAGGKQHNGTKMEKKESPVCVLIWRGQARGDRTANGGCEGDPAGMKLGQQNWCALGIEVGVHQPTSSRGFFPEKWEICHQKAPKLSKTLTSLELFTGKTAHRFTHCPPLPMVLMPTCTWLWRDLGMSVPFPTTGHFPWFLGFFWGSETAGAAHSCSLCILKICCYLFGLI